MWNRSHLDWGIIILMYIVEEDKCGNIRRQEGEINKAVEIEKNLLKEGIDITLVAKSTGLSKSEVEKLKIDFIN